MRPPCPCCGSACRLAGSLRDDRYGEPGRFPLLRCLACGHHHLSGGAAGLDPARLYGERYPRRAIDPSRWKPVRLAGWLAGDRASAWRWVPPGVRVLDIGTGLGEALGWHRARGCDAHGTDPDPALAAVAALHGLQVRVGPFDEGQWQPHSFDVITMDQVLEHLPKPQAVLRAAHRLLRPGGRLIVTTPNGQALLRKLLGQRWAQWHAPYHLHIFSPASLATTIRSTGFRPVAHAWTTPGDWPLYQTRHLIDPSPREGSPSPFWRPNANRPLLHRLAGGIAARLHRAIPVLQLAMRALDAGRRGDSMLLIAERQT